MFNENDSNHYVKTIVFHSFTEEICISDYLLDIEKVK
jgi:hypothetical protein